MARSREERIEEKRRELSSIKKDSKSLNAENCALGSEEWSRISDALKNNALSAHNRRKKLEFNENRNDVMLGIVAMAFEGQITIGQLVRMLRRDVLGYSQDQFIELTGINRKTLSKVEGDKSTPSLTVLLGVLRPFGLELAVVPKAVGMRNRLVERLKSS